MTVKWEKMAKLLENKGVSVYKVSKETGISNVTLSDWKLGKSTPKLDKLEKIANFFGVPISYFTGEEEATFVLDDYEQRLVEMFRSMSEQGKARLLETAELLSTKYKKGLSSMTSSEVG